MTAADRHREFERCKLRARIITVRGLLPEYGGKTLENVLQALEAIYKFRYEKE